MLFVSFEFVFIFITKNAAKFDFPYLKILSTIFGFRISIDVIQAKAECHEGNINPRIDFSIIILHHKRQISSLHF